ncbi:MAG: SusE domain-containing protein [Luteibaculaceae bacterium]
MKNNSFLRKIWTATALLFWSILVVAQTNPAPFNLSTGSFTFNGFAVGTITEYPAHTQGWSFAAEPTLVPTNNTLLPPAADRVLSTSTLADNAGGIRNEVEGGLSILNSGTNHIGAFAIALNTLGRENITLSWVAEDIRDVDTRTSGLILQYRVGSEGNFTNVENSLYTSNPTDFAPAQTFSDIVLPANANNQELVQVRFLYHNIAGGGGRDRIRLDNIEISSSELNTDPVQFSLLGPANGTILDLNTGVPADLATISWEAVPAAANYTFRLALSGGDLDNPLFTTNAEVNSLELPFSAINNLLLDNGVAAGTAASFIWDVVANLPGNQTAESEEQFFVTFRTFSSGIIGLPFEEFNQNVDNSLVSASGAAVSLIGGVNQHSLEGTPLTLRIDGFPEQSTNNRTAGIQFFASTVGQENINIQWEQRASGTASRWASFEYTTDGGTTWIIAGNNYGGLFPRDIFYTFTIDLSAVEAVNNNPDFGFRVVSMFGPMDFNDGLGNSFLANTAYQRNRADNAGEVYQVSGNWRFNNIIVAGTEIGVEPLALIAPANNAAVNLGSDLDNGVVTFNFELATTVPNASYNFLLMAAGQLPTNPALTVPLGSEEPFSLTFAAIDNALAGLGIPTGTTNAFTWTIQTVDADNNTSLLHEVFNVTLTRSGFLVEPIVRFNFPTDDLVANIGQGNLSLIGGVVQPAGNEFDNSAPTPRAIRFNNFPEQSTASGTAGIQFTANLTGFEQISVSYDHYASNTANRWAELQYTLDATAEPIEWISAGNNNGAILNGNDYFPFNFSLVDVEGLNNNPNAAFRIVSIFSPIAFEDGLGNSFGANEAYHRVRNDNGGGVYVGSGNWRIGNLTVSGVESEPVFNLLTPVDGTQLNLNTLSPTQEITISWSEAINATVTEYFWQVAAGGTDFLPEPALSLSAGTNTSLVLTAQELDEALAGLGFIANETAGLIWRVSATLDGGAMLLSEEVFEIEITRYNNFSLLTPVNETAVDLGSNDATTPVTISWEPVFGAESYVFQLVATDGDFSNAIEISVAAPSTELILTFADIDATLANAGVGFDETFNGQWRVVAQLADEIEVISDEVFTLDITRTDAPISTPEAIVFWNFLGDVITPAIGEGVISPLNLTSPFAFAAGSQMGVNRGLNTLGYPAQSSGSGTAGIQFSTSTIGFKDIKVSYKIRPSNTASRWSQVQYSVDNGTTWNVVEGSTQSMAPEVFTTREFDLSLVGELNNQENIAFRVVSVFSPVAFTQGTNSFEANTAYHAAGPTQNYSPAGTIRFTEVLIEGTPVTLPEFALLTPANNTELDLNSNEPTTPVNITWEAAEGTVNYTWLAILPTGNFNNPLLSIPAGNTPNLELTFADIDAALASLNIGTGATVTVQWSVRATLDNGLNVLAQEPFTLTLTRIGVLQDGFALLTPPSGTVLTLNVLESQEEVTITWEEVTTAESYAWLVDLPGGNFTNPALNIPSATNALTLTQEAIDQALAGLGFIGGSSTDLIWTVRANLPGNEFILADEPFDITIVRFNAFSLLTPPNNTTVDLGSNEASTPVSITWQPLANATSYTFQLDVVGGDLENALEFTEQDTDLVLTFGAIDAALADLGVAFEATFNGIWRVVANLPNDETVVSTETWNVNFIRTTQPPVLPQAIAFWDFEGDVLFPAVGNGTFEPLNMTGAVAFFAGNGSASAVNITGFAPQGAESGNRGAEVFVSTVNHTEIIVSLDVRASATGSRWFEFQITTNNGETWVPFANNNGDLAPGAIFRSYTFDLTDEPNVANNPGFGFRVVSIFSPVAFGDNAANTAYQPAGTGGYSPASTWRFDNVLVQGLPFTTFNLLSPADGTIINLDEGTPETLLTATWQAFTGAVNYIFLADVPFGSFAEPVAALPAGNNTSINLPYSAVDELLASLDFEPGTTVLLDWTVVAVDANENTVFANQAWNLSIIRLPVGINELGKNEILTLFPNPANSQFTLQGKTERTVRSIELVDGSGRIIENRRINRPITGAEVFDINHLSHGLYFVRLIFDDSVATLKLMKK